MKINIIHAAFDGDPDEVVFSYDDLGTTRGDRDVLQACARAFRMFNAPLELLDDEDALIAIAYRTQNLRSLSVGDIVEVHHPSVRSPQRWVCEPSGWKRSELKPTNLKPE